MSTSGNLTGNSLHQQLILASKSQGFVLSGGVDLDLAMPQFREHSARYSEWIANGYAGEMNYLVRGEARRMDPRIVFEDTQSVFCVALPYPAAATPSEGARYARYMQILPDYHTLIAQKLEEVMSATRATLPATTAQSLKWKVCVDTSAVLERSWAFLAGLGWIGKNSLLIHPQWGSYFLIGVVLLNQKLDRGPAPLPNFCGNCTRCLEGCPTQAFESAGTLNSKQCISYWTLEKRGTLELTQDQQKKLGANAGSWVGGCDVCQEVCPFNQKRAKAQTTTKMEESPFLSDWKLLLAESPEAFIQRTKNTALDRMKPAHFDRNLAHALLGLSPMHRSITLEEILQRIEWHPSNEHLWQQLLKNHSLN